MTDAKLLKDDLAYVRAAAGRSGPGHVPGIYFLWALLCLCGFTLIDLVGPGSKWTAVYWFIAGPAGTGLTWWFASQAGRRTGQADRRKGKRWAAHFLAFFAAGLLGCGLAATGELSWSGLSSLWILLLALTYFLAGLHLERHLIPVATALAAGFVVTLFLPEYRFTTAGVLVALALAVQGLRGTGQRHATN